MRASQGSSRTSGPRVSAAVDALRISAIKEMAMRSAAVHGAASLAWGLPSFRTPSHIRAAVARALDEDPDVGKYALPDGLPALREQIARRHLAATGVEVDPRGEVIVTAGNMQGLTVLLRTLLEPGDEVIVTDPGFVSHIAQISLCGGVPVYWPLREADDWSLDVDALETLITARSKALILVSPSNPTGRIFSEAELRRIGDMARAAGVFVLLDDPYSHFAYEHRSKYFNLASVPEMGEHLAYLFTFSKAHAMSGWRLGYAILPPGLKHHVLKVHDANLICAPRVSQVAGLAALSEPAPHVDAFASTLAGRKGLICERLDAIPHVFEYVEPQGAYYVFPRILVEHQDAFEFSLRLLEEARVTVTRGSAFGPCGEHHVRMAYCVDDNVINCAFDRIEKRYPA